MSAGDSEPSWLRASDETTPLMGSGVASLRDPELPPATDTDDDEHSTTSGGRDAVLKTVVKRGFKKDKVRKEVWHDNEPAGQPVQLVVSPMKNCCLHFFHWFEALAIMSCLGVLTTQLIPLVIVPLKELGFLQTVLRIYVSLFSVAFILVELRVPWPFLRKAHLLQTYFSRGLLYTFLGVVVMEEAYSGRIDDMVHHASSEFHVAWAPLFMQISSWFVFGIGCFYMIFGLCCLQLLRDNLHKKHEQQVAEFQRLHNEIVN